MGKQNKMLIQLGCRERSDHSGYMTDEPLIPDQDATQGHGVDFQQHAFFFQVTSQSEALSDETYKTV